MPKLRKPKSPKLAKPAEGRPTIFGYLRELYSENPLLWPRRAVEAVKERFPDSCINVNAISVYKNKLRAEGLALPYLRTPNSPEATATAISHRRPRKETVTTPSASPSTPSKVKRAKAYATAATVSTKSKAKAKPKAEAKAKSTSKKSKSK